MGKIDLYEIGKRAQAGDEKAMLEIINLKKWVIKKYSCGNEDCYQTIILNIVKGIKTYRF